MQRLALITLGIFLTSLLLGQKIDTYSIIEVELDDRSDIMILDDLGVAVDHVHWEEDGSVELFVNSREKAIIAKYGFRYKTIIANTKAHADKIASQNKRKTNKSNACGLDQFTLGSIGGYHDYTEVVSILENITKAYPDITKLLSIGLSHEERDIWVLKVSDNAATDESAQEGTAYYDALTHAREPLSMMSTLYYIQWLLENYENPQTIAKFLIDTREMHFILVVNPDGYEYNTTLFPNGGGGWRKNRRVIDGECIGVDLNRNFNAQYNGPGSHSNNPCSDLYRGPSATSEAETQRVQDYIGTILPAAAFSSHSYSQVILDPDKKVDNPFYDFAQYANYASEFTPESHLGYGSADDLIGYLASGTTLDYLFESGAVAWTPEIGTRFWEPQEDICKYVSEMLKPMQFISKIAGAAPAYANHYLPNDAQVINGESIELYLGIKNKGLKPSNGRVSVTLTPIDHTNKVLNSSINYQLNEDGIVSYNEDEPFRIELSDLTQNQSISFRVQVFEDDLLVDITEIIVHPGAYDILFKDDFENGMDNWVHASNGEQWSIDDTDSRSGKHSLVDSKAAHAGDIESYISLAVPVDLSGTQNPWLFFDLKHSLNQFSASLEVSISGDGTSWETLKPQDNGPRSEKDGYTGHRYWETQALNLTEFAEGTDQLYVRYSIKSEGSRTADGVYIDDVEVIDLGSTDATSPNQNQELSPEIKIYPNPSEGIFNITHTNNSSPLQEIQLLNNLGQKLIQRTNSLDNRLFKLDLSNYQSGTYYIRMKYEDYILNTKLIKL